VAGMRVRATSGSGRSTAGQSGPGNTDAQNWRGPSRPLGTPKAALSDVPLCTAAPEIEQGRYEADLGGGVCKKARSGRPEL
jgi:RelE toxin of RelEB toxin-antitoxin system